MRSTYDAPSLALKVIAGSDAGRVERTGEGSEGLPGGDVRARSEAAILLPTSVVLAMAIALDDSALSATPPANVGSDT